MESEIVKATKKASRYINQIVSEEKDFFIEELADDINVSEVDKLILSKVLNEYRDRIMYRIYDIGVSL
jgi:asparagine synthetase A